MNVQTPLALLGGLSARAFMRRHWQRRPLLVRAAWPGIEPPLGRAALFRLAARDEVESRLVVRSGRRWSVEHGPLARRRLPALATPDWTLLVQGLDLHVPAARRLLDAFRFVPDARLDDLMISWAARGGGVGPHLDSYDVFLLQVHGRRRWRIGRAADPAFVPGLPLRILRRFEPEGEWVLEPGDLLYLPPRWAHDGVALDDGCMTCSVGFRAPAAGEVARALLARLGDAPADDRGAGAALYRDPGMPATPTPGAIPPALQAFARSAVERLLATPDALERALGEWLSEPKPQVWFARDGAAARAAGEAARCAVRLDRRTRMLYDERHVYLNGESYRASGRDARLMRRLADERRLDAAERGRLSAPARAQVAQWLADGWLQPAGGESDEA